MKAVRIHTPGGPEVLTYEDVPEPRPKAGEAVVKVDAAGLNYIDVYYRSGLYKAELPMTLGMEACRAPERLFTAEFAEDAEEDLEDLTTEGTEDTEERVTGATLSDPPPTSST